MGTPEERLLDKLREVDGPLDTPCWMFVGWWQNGYGKFHYKGKDCLAHRVAFTLWVGPIPNNMDVLHHCDNTWCCHPKHLFIGTQRDNNEDMFAKGRAVFPKGSQNGMSSITEAQAIEIKTLLGQGYSGYAVAQLFGISHDVVYNIKYKRTWRHL